MKKQKYMNFDEYSKTFVRAWRESAKNGDVIHLYNVQHLAELTSGIFGCDEQEKVKVDNWFVQNAFKLLEPTRVLFAQFLRAKDDKTMVGRKFLKMIQPVGDLYTHIPPRYSINSNERQQHIAAALFFMNMMNIGKIKDKLVTRALLCQIENVIEHNMNANIVGKSYEMIRTIQK